MLPSTASKTALTTALMRALHTRADPFPIIDDPWGDLLVPEVALAALKLRVASALVTDPPGAVSAVAASDVEAWLRESSAYATVITRTRYAEDALHIAIAGGCTQYVMLGAGFESYALRRPAHATHVHIYEVDHPATQALKRQRLQECNIRVPETIHFLAADLATESLTSVLARSNFDIGAPSFFSWLGVTTYLSQEANLASLQSIRDSMSDGSELVFTYIDQMAFDTKRVSTSVLAQATASVGESLLSGFYPETLAQDLNAVGFMLLEDLDCVSLIQKYDPRGLNQLRPATSSHIAHARKAHRGGAA